jgi:hypothetical protein
VARLVFLVAGLRLDALVFLLHFGIGHRVLAHPVADVGADERLLAGHFDLRLHLGVLDEAAALRLLGDDLAVDELVAHHRPGLIAVGHAAARLLLHEEVRARAGHRDTVHRGDGAAFRGWLWLGGVVLRRLFRRQRGLLGRRGGSEREQSGVDPGSHGVPFASSGLRAVMASAWIGCCIRAPSAW